MSMSMLLSGKGTPDKILNRMNDISGRHTNLSSPPSTGKSNVSFALPEEETAGATVSEATAKSEAAEEVKGAGTAVEQPAACVTPAQQKKEVQHQPTTTSEHAGVARNLEEAAMRENANVKFKETLNNPCPEDAEVGTTV